MADDAYSIFQNPAGLCRIKKWQLASMYSKLIQEVDYNQLGYGLSLGRDALGVAFIGASVGGSLWSKRDPVTERIVPEGEGAIGYKSEVLFLTYSFYLSKYLTYPQLKNLSIGLNVKMFNQSLTGLPTRDVYAMGHDLDMGLQYQPNSWLILGAAGYNVLPYSMGGKLMWGSGIEESIPAEFKLGFAAMLIGEGGLREFIFYPQELYLSYDYEFALSGDRPALSHIGLEWRPFEILALRLGLDQDAVATGAEEIGIDNNLAAGVGLHLFNLRFDYAFHTFGVLSANDTHFFSITYGVEPRKFPAYAPPEPEEYIVITEPGKKHITFDTFVVVKGGVTDLKRVKKLLIEGNEANLYEDGTFMSVVKLPGYGRTTVEVRAIGETGRILEAKDLTVVRLVSFTDVGDGHPLRVTLGAMAALGNVSGYKDGTFKPDGFLTRAELATLLVRIMATEEVRFPLHPVFKDVPARHWASRYVAEALKAGLVKGFPDGLFRPSKGVTRAQAISLFVRFAGLVEPPYIYEKPFPDVAVKHWAARAIHVARKAGFLDYLKGKDFDPNRKITRGEVVDILSKIERISKKLSELLE